MAVLPMFPLGTVLLPGGILPLHVFEPRYRRLVEDCLADEPEFGVVLIERGSEVGGGDVRTSVGTIARMLEVGRFEDGRFALRCIGMQRLRVMAWLPDDPYPLADIEPWPEELEGVDDESLRTELAPVVAQLRRALALATELGEPAAPAATVFSEDPIVALYQACSVAPVGPVDTYALLATPGPRERTAALAALLTDAIAVMEFRLGSGSG
jgi:uncharacterized protein